MFDAAENMELIDQSLLMMAGAQADTLYMTQDCYDKATSSKDKELFLVEGAHEADHVVEKIFVSKKKSSTR